MSTSQKLTHLTPYTDYRVKVVVVSRVVQGLWSVEKRFKTDSDGQLFSKMLYTLTRGTTINRASNI